MAELECVVIGSGFVTRQARGALAQLRQGDEVRLERRPENEYDPNAVACLFLGLHVGWIPRKLNPPVAEAMDGGQEVKAVCTRPPQMEGDRVKVEALVLVSWRAA